MTIDKDGKAALNLVIDKASQILTNLERSSSQNALPGHAGTPQHRRGSS